MLFAWITDPNAWLALGTLTLLEIVLGIDNIIFLSLVVAKLPTAQRAHARRLGLAGAMVMRLALLASIAWVTRLTNPLFTIFSQEISARDLILLLGGLFLIWKASKEIHESIEGEEEGLKTRVSSFLGAIVQIMLLDIIFSLDSVITAVGLSDHLFIMMAAVVIAVGVMMFASIPNLLKRAAIMAEIRRFFADRGVLEVETPCMSQATVTDIHLVPFETRFVGPGHSQGMNLWLMTSPEYHMKRLLVAGCGPVFQLCRSFRNEEMGRYHNPEFTMLEWYRPHYDMYRLMNEVDDLLQQVLDCPAAESLSYQQAFLRYLEIDPLSADKTQLREVAAKLDLSNVADTEEDRDTLLQLLFTFGVEPNIGKEKPTFVYHFPASQASLAQISTEDHRVAERFEVYYKGIELANGFHELTDAREQQQRFEQDNRKRAARGLPQHPIDQNLIEALKVGMPDCSGVALGVDRLVMLALGAETLAEVIAFSVDRA